MEIPPNCTELIDEPNEKTVWTFSL